MSRIVITSFDRLAAFVQRHIQRILVVASLTTSAALLGLCITVAGSSTTPYNRGMLAILGATLALAPYVLARALEQVVKDC